MRQTRNSPRLLRSGSAGVSHGVTGHGARQRYWRLLTMTLVACSLSSTSVLAQQSSVFGPSPTPPRATAVHLTAHEARAIAATLSDCETVAVELVETRAETRVLREAVELSRRSADAYAEAARLQAARADAEAQRALNESLLRAGAEAELKRERRSGRWRALRWCAIALGAGIVVGLVAGQ